MDGQDGTVVGHDDVLRESNPGGCGAFYDQAQATVAPAADRVMASLVLSLGSKGNLRATMVKVFPEARSDKIIVAVA